MKKIISTITVFVYFTVTCGVMVNFHYCMDRYSSFKFYAAADEKCDLCGMNTKNSDCCRDEIKILKLEDDQKTSEIVFSFYDVLPLEITPSEFICSAFFTVPVSEHFNYHSPPLIPLQDTYLQNCVFRI
jgi:hypothetical protein